MIRLDFIDRLKKICEKAYPLNPNDCYRIRQMVPEMRRTRFERLHNELDLMAEAEQDQKLTELEGELVACHT